MESDPAAGRFSRRQLIVGGGTAAAIAAGALGGPRLYRHWQRSHAGLSVPLPPIPTAVESFSFRSAARGTTVHGRMTMPSAVRRDHARMCVWLHGRSGTAASAMDELAIPNFLAAAVRDGVAPFGVVSVDGGNRYWHRRRDGDDPETMVVHELPHELRRLGLTVERWSIAGWSMGGYGALLLAERHPQFRAVAASSAAVWFKGADTRPGAFDDADDFARNNVLAILGSLAGRARIDCGRDDPFASTSQHMLRHLPRVEGSITDGAHTMRFWRSVLPDQLRFLGSRLAD